MQDDIYVEGVNKGNDEKKQVERIKRRQGDIAEKWFAAQDKWIPEREIAAHDRFDPKFFIRERMEIQIAEIERFSAEKRAEKEQQHEAGQQPACRFSRDAANAPRRFRAHI